MLTNSIATIKLVDGVWSLPSGTKVKIRENDKFAYVVGVCGYWAFSKMVNYILKLDGFADKLGYEYIVLSDDCFDVIPPKKYYANIEDFENG